MVLPAAVVRRIRTQLASGTAPDVMSVWRGNGNPGTVTVLAKGGYPRDLSETYNAIYGVNGIGSRPEVLAGHR